MCVHSRSSQETTPDFFQSIHRCRQVSLLRGPRLYISLARCNFSISLSLFGYYSVSNGTQGGECSGSLCFSLSLSARPKATHADLLKMSHIIRMGVCAAVIFSKKKLKPPNQYLSQDANEQDHVIWYKDLSIYFPEGIEHSSASSNLLW